MRYSFLELAYDVLSRVPGPLTYQQIWEEGVKSGLAAKVGSTGKTPWDSIGSQLYVDVRDNPSSKFARVGKRPTRFTLKDRVTSGMEEGGSKIEPVEEIRPKGGLGYRERDLHPVLTYYAYANPTFNRGRAIVTKTIDHAVSKKNGYSEWSHPDIVGFSVPLEDWQDDVIALNELTDRNAVTLFSFELKRHLTKSTYRESYFQAVSNSSWAHQGYLVAAEISEDDDLLAELDRLASSFGIGIIHLNLEDMSESRVLYPARTKSSLDWETINKLAEQNGEFEEFVRNVKIDVNSRKVHRSEYDEVIQDIDAFVKKFRKDWIG